MAATDGTFIFVATYPDEASAQDDYQVVKELHAGGLVGSYDAAVVTKDASGKVHENKDETATRHGAWGGIAAGAAVGVLFARLSSARQLSAARSARWAATCPRACHGRVPKNSVISSTPARQASSSLVKARSRMPSRKGRDQGREGCRRGPRR